MTAVQLIVGLGNPGPEYDQTRHNAGPFSLSAWRMPGVSLVADRKYFGLVGKFSHQGKDVRLLIPTTYMNRSGQSVAALADSSGSPRTPSWWPTTNSTCPWRRQAQDRRRTRRAQRVARHHRPARQSEFFPSPAAWHRPSGAQQPGFRLRARPRPARAGTARHQHRLRPRRAAGNARRGLDPGDAEAAQPEGLNHFSSACLSARDIAWDSTAASSACPTSASPPCSTP